MWEAIAQTVVVVTTRGAGYFIAGPFGEFNPFRIWDNYRIARWYAESVNSTSEVKYHSPLRNLPITLPDYWRMDGYVLGFIPRSLLNATPRNNILGYILSWFVMPQQRIAYDIHRIFEGGWETRNIFNAEHGKLNGWYWDSEKGKAISEYKERILNLRETFNEYRESVRTFTPSGSAILHDIYRVGVWLFTKDQTKPSVAKPGLPAGITFRGGQYVNGTSNTLNIRDVATGTIKKVDKGIRTNDRKWDSTAVRWFFYMVWCERRCTIVYLNSTTQTPDAIIQAETSPDGEPYLSPLNDEVILDKSKIGPIVSLEAKVDGVSYVVHAPQTLTGAPRSLRDNRMLAAVTIGAMLQAEEHLGRRSRVPTDILLVPPAASPAYGGLTVFTDPSRKRNGAFVKLDASLEELMATIAHEHVHNILGVSPIADFTEGGSSIYSKSCGSD